MNKVEQRKVIKEGNYRCAGASSQPGGKAVRTAHAVRDHFFLSHTETRSQEQV